MKLFTWPLEPNLSEAQQRRSRVLQNATVLIGVTDPPNKQKAFYKKIGNKIKFVFLSLYRILYSILLNTLPLKSPLIIVSENLIQHILTVRPD